MRIIQNLEDEQSLEEMWNKPSVIIFKNSMTCGISRRARGQLEKYAEECEAPVEIFMVDVNTSRALSKEIEKKTGIHHESPQAICMKNGKVVWHASHFSITTEAMKKAVENQD